MKNPQQQGLNIDFKNTTAIEGFDGGHLFGQAFILRKVSKFVTGTGEDGVIPIPIFYDVQTGKLLLNTLPKELREEYENVSV